MRPSGLKLDNHVVGALVILVAAAGIMLLTWSTIRSAIRVEHQGVERRVSLTVSRQALSFEEQISRQLLSLDQDLRIMVNAWERDPERFDLQGWHNDAPALAGISRDMVLVDQDGIVRQSTMPEAIGGRVGDEDYFRYARQHGTAARQHGAGDDRLFVGNATIGPVTRQGHMHVARWLHHPDGSFAGVLMADYRLSAITGLLQQADRGDGGMLALVGLIDGRLRAGAGPGTAQQDTSIADTPMFAAMQAGDGIWIGRSAPNTTLRIHAFRRVPDRDLVVIAAMDSTEAMAPAARWARQARLVGGCITVLLALMTLLLLHGVLQARRRKVAFVRDRTILAVANARLEVAKAHADAKAAQLEATLAGMSDGVSMIDEHLCLVEWNARFPEIAGIPPELLRVGLPMKEILLAQAVAGQFGPVDPKAEVSRRMAALRTGETIGTIDRRRPDGRIVELRRNRLPDRGFVTLYADITERKNAEEALQQARAQTEAASQAKSRFVAIVSHEIRTPLNALLNSLRLLAGSSMDSSQDALVNTAQQSGDALLALLNDILDMSSMEAGRLALRPSVFALRPLLDSVIEMFLPLAAERGIHLACNLAADVPEAMFTDPGRLRQVLINLLSNAVKFSRPGAVTLLVRPGDNDRDGPATLHLAVRDHGPIIPAEERVRLFRPFSRLGRPENEDPLGTGLGLAICHHIIGLMGGEIGCAPWRAVDGSTGNTFWIRLPIPALPAQPMVNHLAAGPTHGQSLPRTRILLVEDVAANQMVTATLLRREGHMVDIAAHGKAALEVLGRTPYDLVLMDIFMPGLDGLETTQRIRAMPGPAAALPVLALTANVSQADRAIVRQAGMDGLLRKPVALDEMLQAIGQHAWWRRPERRHIGDPGTGELGRIEAGWVGPGALERGAVKSQSVEVEAADRAAVDRGTVAPRADATMPGHSGAVLAADRIEELRANLPADTLGSMIEECLDDLQHRLPVLRRALEDGRTAEIAAQAHAMAGMAAGYGMAALETKMRALMAAPIAAGERGPRDCPRDWGAELEAALQATGPALRAAVQKEMA